MRQFKLFVFFMATSILFGLTSCGNDEIAADESPKGLVGIWVCDWDDEDDYIFCFREDGTGYDYFTSEGLDEYDYFSYKVRGNNITLYYKDGVGDDEYWKMTIEYDLSKDGKLLTLYDLDDDDMQVVHFTRRK